MRKVLSLIWSRVRTKYGIVITCFLLWLFFFDENSLVQHFQQRQRLSQLIEQEQFLRNKILSDQRKIKELQTNLANLEKFAREEFLMKKENEDVFVVVEEE